MTPDSRDWHVRMADRWQGRAAELRADPGRCAQVRAAVLDSIVADLRARLAAACHHCTAPTGWNDVADCILTSPEIGQTPHSS